jgi:hypothetical protein
MHHHPSRQNPENPSGKTQKTQPPRGEPKPSPSRQPPPRRAPKPNRQNPENPTGKTETQAARTANPSPPRRDRQAQATESTSRIAVNHHVSNPNPPVSCFNRPKEKREHREEEREKIGRNERKGKKSSIYTRWSQQKKRYFYSDTKQIQSVQ